MRSQKATSFPLSSWSTPLPSFSGDRAFISSATRRQNAPSPSNPPTCCTNYFSIAAACCATASLSSPSPQIRPGQLVGGISVDVCNVQNISEHSKITLWRARRDWAARFFQNIRGLAQEQVATVAASVSHKASTCTCVIQTHLYFLFLQQTYTFSNRCSVPRHNF